MLLICLVIWVYIQTKGKKEEKNPSSLYFSFTPILLVLYNYIFFFFSTFLSLLIVYLVLSFTFSDSRQEDWLGKTPNYQKCLPLPCFRCKVCWKGLCFCGYIFDFLKVQLPCCWSSFRSSTKDSKIESHTHACMHAHKCMCICTYKKTGC